MIPSPALPQGGNLYVRTMYPEEEPKDTRHLQGKDKPLYFLFCHTFASPPNLELYKIRSPGPRVQVVLPFSMGRLYKETKACVEFSQGLHINNEKPALACELWKAE